MDENKQKALEAAMAQIEKQFGKGSVMKMDGTEIDDSIEAISTGSLGLDIALGIGGLPKGRVVEIYGPESSGKTSLTLSVIAAAQKAGGTAAFIDAEHALDTQYAAKLGVNLTDLLISQPDTGEQALEITDMLVRFCGFPSIVYNFFPNFSSLYLLCIHRILLNVGYFCVYFSSALTAFIKASSILTETLAPVTFPCSNLASIKSSASG